MTLRKALNNYVESTDDIAKTKVEDALNRLQAALVGMATEDAEQIGSYIFSAVCSLVEVRERGKIMEDLLQLMTECSDAED